MMLALLRILGELEAGDLSGLADGDIRRQDGRGWERHHKPREDFTSLGSFSQTLWILKDLPMPSFAAADAANLARKLQGLEPTGDCR